HPKRQAFQLKLLSCTYQLCTNSILTTDQVQTPYHRLWLLFHKEFKSYKCLGCTKWSFKLAADLEKTIPTSSHARYWMATFSLQGNLNLNSLRFTLLR
uniref:Uncharacterized protein n=1 Tax=Aquila chrysaetos chrysaetos TaxID=223781 RepID=A0A663E4Q4_AQUCH